MSPSLQLDLLRPDSVDDVWTVDEGHPVFADPYPGAHDLVQRLEVGPIEICWKGRCVAVAEARGITLTWSDSSGGGDHDNYVALRLIERREDPVWEELPWRDLPVGSVFLAWDHYGNAVSRAAAVEAGLWNNLEAGWSERQHHSWFG
ncbi:MAG: hypothetical protein WKG01_19300 [Kofleriaceae bacterium]